MTETQFVSDLHLDPGRPGAIRLFERFLDERAPQAEAVYILGDLFEYWIGDDDPAPWFQGIFQRLAALHERGIPSYFIHGNRDFLIGRKLARRCGMRLLPEALVVDLYGERTLLMHGDTLCSDDVKYLAFRRKARNPLFQKLFLWRSLKRRRAIAEDLRAKSRMEVQAKTADIMDVNGGTVQDTMRQHGVRRLIHGHTHRPAVHQLSIDGADATRTVLGDWHEDRGSVLTISPSGSRLEAYP